MLYADEIDISGINNDAFSTAFFRFDSLARKMDMVESEDETKESK